MTTNDILLLPDGRMLQSEQLTEHLGWEAKPEGLCQGDSCVVVPDMAELIVDGRVDAVVAAQLLDRPAVEDPESGIVAIGAPRAKRRSALEDLRAPDFTLPNLDGTPHSLSDHRSKKRLLVAFSSW